ncbi:hypothetical protein RHSIM_Rhsim05G0142900 [Rhododendron simsii]|uniref:NLP1-9 GAF domain-containing protein n=1 Tax=Rhododendron simsii TaxID=118357 RepID=A0A834H1Y9_RHOSS|nr:hypothetical protein RHSIM_Rhsim05G0142900 [Rhododendron simsii]
MIWHPSLDQLLELSLIQFWAATKTSEGRTLLTTQNQPFALGTTYYKTSRQWLGEYRMTMCREYNNYFYADAESGEEQLGLLGLVFLHKFPESTPSVKYYSLKEYPQLDLALRCKIDESWALPVFERSSQTYVGVLELVYTHHEYLQYSFFGSEKSFMDHLDDIFQEFGLQCSNGYKHYEMQYRDENKALTAAIRELKMVLRSVCKVHELPLAMTWVPCSACNGLVRAQLMSKGVEFRGNRNGSCKYAELDFLKNGQKLHSVQLIQATRFSPSLEPLKDGGVMLQLGQLDQPSMDAINNGMNVGGEEQNCILPSLVHLQNGEVTMQLDSSYRPSVQLIQATRFSPRLEPLKDGGGVMLQLGQLDQPSMDGIHSGMNVIGEEQDCILPSLEPLQNREATMQLDSSDQLSMDSSNNGQNVVITAKQNSIVEFDLQCSNGYKHYEMQYRDEKKALTAAIQELKMVLRSVCKVHELPLAMTWVPCSACNGLVRVQLMSKGVEFHGNRNNACKYAELEFLKVIKCSHFRNGCVTGWALSSPNMLYCSDITQLS